MLKGIFSRKKISGKGNSCVLKNIFSIILALCITGGSILSSCMSSDPLIVDADSSAKSRVQTFIGLAAGKSGNDLPDIGQLTQDELLFLGVYLSNFYMPFSTEIGVSGNKETLEAQRNAMKEALKANMNFNDTVCDALIDNIIGLSRSNCKELVVRFVDKDGIEIQTFDSIGGVSYWDFMNLMSGKFYQANFSGLITDNGAGFSTDSYTKFVVDDDGNEVEKNVFNISSLNYFYNDFSFFKKNHDKSLGLVNPSELEERNKKAAKYVEFGYFDSKGDFKVVFDSSLNSPSENSEDIFSDDINPTACQYALSSCIRRLSGTPGYVFDFFDISSEDLDGTTDDVLTYLQNNMALSKDDIYKMSAYGDKMCVDCFGNIIRYGANHQTIIVPGCVNPYTWMRVRSDGTDYYSSYCMEDGQFRRDREWMNGVSLQILSEISQGTFGSEDALYSSSIYARNANFSLGNYTRIAYNDWNDSNVLEDLFVNGHRGSYFFFPEVRFENNDDDSSNDIWLDGAACTKWYFNRGYNTDEVPASAWSALNMCFGYNENAYTMYDILCKKGKRFGSNSDPARDSGGYLSWCNGGFNSEGNEPVIKSSVGAFNVILGSPYLISTGFVELDVNMCMIDNLGAFGFESSGSDIAYNAINFVPYVDESGNLRSSTINLNVNDSLSFGSLLNDKKRGIILDSNVLSGVSQEALVSLYTTYAIAGLYTESGKEETIGRLGYRINRGVLPEIANSPLLISDSYADDLINMNIRNWIYYLLHPSQGIEYFKILVRNKLNGVLADWHASMVGTNGTGITTGTTYYRTNYGYVTTPDLSELQWTNSLISLYENLTPILIILMVVVMLLSFVTGVMSLQRAIFAVVIFSVFLLVPVNALNSVVMLSNNATNSIYGDKFLYWALVQEETYGTALDEYAFNEDETSSEYNNYLRTLYSMNSANQGGESIVLRWQAPKKMASLMLSRGDKSLLSKLKGSLLNGGILNSTHSGESYLDGDSQYLYRDYSDIANFSRYVYHGMANGGARESNHINYGSNISSAYEGFKDGNNYTSYRKRGYTGVGNPDSSGGHISAYKWANNTYLNAVSDSIVEKVKSGNVSMGEYVGLNQELFNVSLAWFNKPSLTYPDAILENVKDSEVAEVSNILNTIGEDDYNNLMVYGMFSESPFYYFSWRMYDDGMSADALANNGYRNMLLGDSEGGYFYNLITGQGSTYTGDLGFTDGNGELKDFLNMRCFFKDLMPYLNKGNNLVRAWDDVYGIYLYDGVPTEEGYQSDPSVAGDSIIKKQYWHNLNVARLYEVYTPWLDLMYDCSYAKPCYISAGGTKYYVEDPLNPASYPDARPMVYSESEMVDYGMTESDLTEVERKILEFNRACQEDMYELLNYYNFSDLSLNTAAAMSCTFNFNRIFSETGIFSNNIVLYPQTFEIKDFSFDAFLRFILATTTGESMTATNDFYGDLISKSSTTVAILLIVVDILSQYVLPFAKIVFLIAIFISSILLILVTLFRVDPDFKFAPRLLKDITIPLLEFLVTTIGFAYVISLFMGVGNNAVTQSEVNVISLGDPAMVIIALCVVDVVCVAIYVKLLMGIWRNIKTNANIIKDSVSSLTIGAIAMGAGAVSKVTSGSIGGGSKGSENGGSYNEIGTGRSNARAERRSSKSKEDIRDASDMSVENNRVSETRRLTAKQVEGTSSEDRKRELNKAIEGGRKKMNKESSKK